MEAAWSGVGGGGATSAESKGRRQEQACRAPSWHHANMCTSSTAGRRGSESSRRIRVSTARGATRIVAASTTITSASRGTCRGSARDVGRYGSTGAKSSLVGPRLGL